jgi:fatty acid amide hydrolase
LTAQLFLFRQHFQEALNGGNYDAILCPPSAFPALPHNVQDFALPGGVYGSLYNLLGMPAGVVPVTKVLPEEEHLSPSRSTKQHWVLAAIAVGSAGLPVGVQVIARHWREDVALAIMTAIEKGRE